MVLSPLGVLATLNILLVLDAVFSVRSTERQEILTVIRDTTRIIGPWVLAIGYVWVGLIAGGEHSAKAVSRRRSQRASQG